MSTLKIKHKIKPNIKHKIKPNIKLASTPSSVESIYKKLKHREHVLKLPDTYIGSTSSEQKEMFIYDEQQNQMVKRSINFVPGLYKIFDEILVNMRDHYVRMNDIIKRQPKIKAGQLPLDPKIDVNRTYYPVKTIEVHFNLAENQIVMKNDGDGLDVAWHSDEQMYIPQMIMGSLLTGTNFDTNEGRITGGKNGYGGTCCNIFSTEFIVETVDASRKKKYIQRFTDNLSKIEPPKIITCRARPYTQISFKPDLKRFGLNSLSDDDTILLMKKRVYDLAACTPKEVIVYLDGQKLTTRNFERYVDLYIGARGQTKRIYSQLNDYWEVAICASPDRTFEQVSFVNGICTYRGGKHVDRIANLVSTQLTKYANEHKKGVKNLSARFIRENMWIFLNCTIVEPDFDTQTKEYLSTNVTNKEIKKLGQKRSNPNRFDPKDLNPELIEKLSSKSVEIIDRALSSANFKTGSSLKKSDGRKVTRVKNAKLIEGKYPGSSKSGQCILILTEGDSARTFAVSGKSALSEEQQRYFGIFPLKGKLINPKDAKLSTIEKNNEFTELKKIIGLKQGVNYSVPVNRKGLRYGTIWIITDSDVDGDHIKGLLINLFHTYWPQLLQITGFFKSLLTPILKVKHRKESKQVKDFYSEGEYVAWKNNPQTNLSNWAKPKYYKGLGTHSPIEAKQCFLNQKLQSYDWFDLSRIHASTPNITSTTISNLTSTSTITSISTTSSIASSQTEQNSIMDSEAYYQYINPQLNKKHPCHAYLELAFSKKLANCRKGWIRDYLERKANGQVSYDLHQQAKISYADFINEKLVDFSVYDNQRNIPSIMDGLKPSQRKVLYTCFKRGRSKQHSEIKVVQLAGLVSKESAYHHGEESLMKTIIGMAQDYVGSNNLNLLDPIGQFGSRLGKGNDAASPRYIFTQMNSVTPLIFNVADSPLLDYVDDDGQLVEPKWYLPILPMILVNGTQGIGTGWMSMVPCYHPKDIIDNINYYLAGQQMKEMTPWYRGFRGTIRKVSHQKYQVTGVYRRLSSTKIEITEIPVGDSKRTKSYLDYKNHIDSLIIDSSLSSSSTRASRSKPQILDDAEVTLSDTTIKCLLTFPSKNQLDQLLNDRAQFEKTLMLSYHLRTNNMYLFNAQGVMTNYINPEDILREFCDHRLTYYQRRKDYQLQVIDQNLLKLNAKIRFITYVNDPDHRLEVKNQPKQVILNILEEEHFPKFTSSSTATPTFDYLLNMKIWALTMEQIEKLKQERDQLTQQREQLAQSTIQSLWQTDLSIMEDQLMAHIKEWEERYQEVVQYHDYRRSNAPIQLKFK